MLAIIGRNEQAASVLAEAFAMLERAGLPRALASYFESSGFLKLFTDDVTSARTHFERALSTFRNAGHESAVLITLLNLADSTWALGDLDDALARFREAVALLHK
jgi:tetratricopeptide (TPR) repeat protein